MTKRKIHAYSHAMLVAGLIDMDRRETAREVKRKIHANPYRLCHYMNAATDIADDIASGIEPRTAFMRRLTPTAGANRIAKSFGWDIDYDEWNRA